MWRSCRPASPPSDPSRRFTGIATASITARCVLGSSGGGKASASILRPCDRRSWLAALRTDFRLGSLVESARRADEADLPAVVRLAARAREELGAAERGGRLFIGRETAPAPALDLADPERIVVVGAIDSTIVGYAVGRVEALREGGRLGIVEELYVEPEARGVAVGEGMMDVLLPWFSEQGCIGVDAAALPGARATKNFFERSGFSARLLVMHHRLGDPGGTA